MSEEDKREDLADDSVYEGGDGPGGESDVEVMAAPQLDDEDAVEISGPGDGAGDPDESEKPAVGHEAEAAMIEPEDESNERLVTSEVPAVMEAPSEDEHRVAEADEAEADGSEAAPDLADES